MVISGSIFAANPLAIMEDIIRVEPLVDRWHFDVMDGSFVPNFALSHQTFVALCAITKKPIHVHLMVTDPLLHIEKFTKASTIVIHAEANNVLKALELANSFNVPSGLALCPKTDLSVVKNFEQLLQSILIMTVEPGFCGQPFIKEMTHKINAAKKMFPSKEIGVDGGVNFDMIKSLCADVFVIGSALFNKGK